MDIKTDDDQEPNQPTSYILLPNKINDQANKAIGVFIAASNLVKRLLPGSNNKYFNFELTIIS